MISVVHRPGLRPPSLRRAPVPGQARTVLVTARHGRVAAVAVGMQRPGEPCEQAFGDIACAGRVILEQHDGRLGAGAHLRPELGLRFRCLAGLFEYLHRGLVHQQVGPFHEFIAQHVDERHYELAHAHHPRRQRRAREFHPDALELLALAIQRQRIAAYFAVAIQASSPGLARLFGTSCAGIGAVRRCPSQHGQLQSRCAMTASRSVSSDS